MAVGISLLLLRDRLKVVTDVISGKVALAAVTALAAAHSHWWHGAVTLDPAKAGVLVSFVGGLDAGNFHVQTESKLFVREPEIVPVKALAEMSHDGAAVAPVPRGPPALAQQAWSSAADSASALMDVPAGSGEVQLRSRAQDDLQARAFASAVDPVNYNQDDEEDTRGHVSDPVRDQTRDDRSFSRSTAKLTPALFAEMTGPGSTFMQGGRSAPSAQTSTLTVREVIEAEPAQDEPQNLLGPIGEPTSFRMLQVTASQDRWTAKILAYPCFDAAFVSALLGTQLANLQVVLAMEVETPGMFAQKAYEWTSKLAPEAHEVFAARPQMLEQFYVFAKAAETLFEESLGYQMGFSRCEKIPRQRSSLSIAEFQRDMAIRALAAPSWLKAIADRAGDHAKPKAPDHGLLSPEEKARLQLLVFTSGAPSTMNHIRRFEKFESWAHRSGAQFYPITNDLVLKYAIELDGMECGPTALPSLRMALRWVSFRTNIALPSIESAEIKALEKEIFTQRGKPLKEADPFPVELVAAMVGLELFELEFPLVERDFWIPDLETKEKWRETPPDYARSLQWLHHLVWHAGSSLPALMIKDLVAEISKDFTPQCALADDVIDDSDDREATLTEFFIKAPEKGSSYEYRFHVCSAESVEEIACKRAITPEFVHVGAKLTPKVDRDPRIPEKEWKKLMEASDALAPKRSATSVLFAPPWQFWSQVPQDPYVVRDLGPWALEIFAGTARLTSQWRSAGLLVLPPIDVKISGEVYESVDLLDDKVFQRVLLLCRVGAIAFLHVGLPCSTFSRARSRPGGPPPLRSLAQPLGLHSLGNRFQDQLDRANLLMQRSIDLLEATIVAGGDASLENPLTSLLWQVPALQQLKVRFHLYNLDLDQCEFGKHKHLPLKGKVRQAKGSWVFATKPAQEYPLPLFAALAQLVEQVVNACLPQFQASFELVAPKQDRKRKLGQAVNWKGHRQEQAARLAASSGYQLKRGAAKPLLDVECEPGVAIRRALGIPHPFTVQPDVPVELMANIDRIAARPLWLVDYRIKQLDYWHARAVALLPDTDRELRAIPDPALRRLLRGAPDYADLQLGHCTHVKLYDELLAVWSLAAVREEAIAGADRGS
ncbi:unnamed protein product [Symbiodinium sp. CCMP2592]|nr:unnamed protein product [Symbiodinium sp. CCMP2592]